MCRVVSLVVGRGCLLWPVCSLGKTLLAFALLHFVLQAQTCLLPQVSLDFLLWHSYPLGWKGCLFLLLVLEGLVGLHRTIQLQLLQHYWLYLWVYPSPDSLFEELPLYPARRLPEHSPSGQQRYHSSLEEAAELGRGALRPPARTQAGLHPPARGATSSTSAPSETDSPRGDFPSSI